ncbi:MAG: hypothetical protein AAGA30_14590, partial [Planctomycetota bacterium]
MKGFVSILLAVMMTGMVFSQQPQSSSLNSEFETPTTNSKLLNRFLLVMGDEYIRVLKTEGVLQAEISQSDQADVDHVEFHGSVLNSDRQDITPHSIFQTSTGDSGSRLQFVLNDALIAIMQRQGLKYIIPEMERGKYREVV